MSDLRKKILDYDDRARQIVDIPEWGDVKIEVRGLTAGERVRLVRHLQDDEGNIDGGAMANWLIVLCSYDPETGERIFEDDDRGAIAEKAPKPHERLMNVALNLSGLAKESEDGPPSSSATTASTGT